MLMTWTDELDTGIPEIDVENRRLAGFINTLESARQTADRDAVGGVLEELLDFVVNHFLFEEHLMQEAGYELLHMHEKIHEMFARRIADFRGRYAKGEDIAAELITMLSNWIQNHVRDEDRRYAESVQEKIERSGGKTWVQGIFNRLFG
jgi:hemerythrin